MKKLLKYLIQKLPKDLVVPAFGANFGKWWILGSANINNWLGRDEKEVQKVFKKYIKKGDTVWDVGANVGFYTLLASSLVGKKGKVYAFEPLSSNFNLLKKHVEINKLWRVSCFELGLSDFQSSGAYFETGVDSSSGHISENGQIRVRLNRGDNYSAPNFVKIDVEGHELQVLKGMGNLLKRNMTIVYEGDSVGEIADYLKSYGFEVQKIDQSNSLAFKNVV